jgi:sec-independent protein translocase protein TatC
MALQRPTIGSPSLQKSATVSTSVHRQYNEDLFESSKMTFGEHLEELRRALIKATLSLIIGFLIGLVFAGDLVNYVQTPLKAALMDYRLRQAKKEYRQLLEQQRTEGLAVPADLDAAAELFAKEGLVTQDHLVDRYDIAELFANIASGRTDDLNLPDRPPDHVIKREDLLPLRIYHRIEDDPRVRVIGLGVQEPFVVYMKAAFVLGAIIASPFIFYFVWEFVAAGLYPHEKRYVHIFLPFSLGLFLAGAALAFFVVFKFVLDFLLTFNEWMGVDPEPRITDWLTFVLILPLGFGISFQLPLVMLFLERIGIFTTTTYAGNWRMSVLVICFIAMVLTPSDPYSMMLMAGPLIFLYFFGIALCKMMPRHTTPFGEVIA